MSDPAPLVLTLAMDRASFAFFERQRRRYFPPERNVIPAHLTLFHTLPGERIDAVAHDLALIAGDTEPFMLKVEGLRFLGRGVAYRIEAALPLMRLRRALADRWAVWLTPQDRQKYQPHVTVQNKTAPDEARALLSRLEAEFTPFGVSALGVQLWHYRGGPWEPAGSWPFGAARERSGGEGTLPGV